MRQPIEILDGGTGWFDPEKAVRFSEAKRWDGIVLDENKEVKK